MRIGYQGVAGSNAETAAINIANKMGFENVEFIPETSSKNVIGELKRTKVDYGVVAIKNSIAGTVAETFEAIKNEYLELVATEILPIHHCVFKKNQSIPNDNITEIASHIQALKQTEKTREKLFPNLIETELADTAIGACWLASGRLNENVAVICRKNAGEANGLALIAENVEDDVNNFTEFRMFKNSTIDYNSEGKAEFLKKLKYACINETGLGYLGKSIMVISILISFFVSNILKMTEWETATLIGGYISALFLLLTSQKLKNSVRFSSLKGYWKYYSIPDKWEKSGIDQRYDTPRIVKIDEVDEQLLFKGFICDRENVPLFESTNVIISSLEKAKGQLVYWYSNPNDINRGYAISGLVELCWISKNPASKINKMSGHYLGKATGETGAVEYLRITKEEFEVHKKSDFL